MAVNNIERVVPETINSQNLSYFMNDLHIWMICGGKERTLEEFSSLMIQAGLKIVSKEDLNDNTSLLEVWRSSMSKGIISTIMKFAGNCKGKMFLSVIFSLLSVAAGFVPYVAIYRLMVEFIGDQVDLERIMIWSLLCLTGYLLKQIFFEISTTLSHMSAYTILETIRLQLTDKLLKLPLGYVINKPIGNLKSVIIDRVETIELPLAHLIPEGVGYIVAPIGVFIYMLSIHWGMALASLITIPIVLLTAGPAMSGVNAKYDEYMKTNNHMNSVIIEYIEGIEVIKIFNQSEKSYEKYRRVIREFCDLTVAWYKKLWVSGNLLSSVMPSTLLGVMPMGMYLYRKGTLSPAELVLCIVLSMGLIAPMMGFSTYINALKIIQYAVAETDEILQLEELSDAESNVKLNGYSIKFDQVSFHYLEDDDENDMALKNVDLFVKEGDFTALIGPSGGGKSTAARLIARFWDTSGGKITIGGVDIKKIPLSQLSHIISYVSQDNYLFNCSLLENIRLGRPDASDEEVCEAARKAMCHEFIIKLEQGYETMAGEAGDKLSGGEKQRISIARMILRDAPIVILDEATAFTDPENEDKIQQAIKELTAGKTLLVIAHRLSTIKDADQIVILKHGKVLQLGTHQGLL